MAKPKILFPFVEAGMGHIVPLIGVADVFEKKYGDKTEVIRTNFYKDADRESMLKFEKLLVSEVSKHSRNNGYAWLSFLTMDLFKHLALKGIMEWFVKGAYDDSMQCMERIKPDLIFSTHWATSYLAARMQAPPINIEYCPDVRLDVLWKTGAETIFMPAESAVARAKKKWVFRKSDIRSVPFIIRDQAFGISRDKAVNRNQLGLREDLFTVTLADGGYGAGKLHDVVFELLKMDTPMNVVAVCGKNTALYEQLKLLTINKNINFVPKGYVDDMLKYIAASDLFVGKSGASSMLEPRFFGIPVMITMYATQIEKENGEYYINEVGSAMKEFKATSVAEKIERFAKNPELLTPYVENAARNLNANGAEVLADYLFSCVSKKFDLN